MSVAFEAGKISLRGNCPVADTEPLLALLQNHAECPVDIGDATNLHAAVLQVLIVFKRDMIGDSRDSFLREWVVPCLPNVLRA